MDTEPNPGSPPAADHAAHKSLSEIVDHMPAYDFWKATQPSPVEDKRFTEDPAKYFRYEFKPLSVMLPFGTIGLLLLAGQVFMPPKLIMGSVGDLTGVLRLGMIMGGAFCVFLAWPRYRDLRATDAEEQATEELRERLAHLRFKQ